MREMASLAQTQVKPKPLPSPSPPAAPMMKRLLTPLTIFTYLLSLPALAGGIWLLCMRSYTCENLLRMPQLKIALGVGMLAVFIISNAVVLYGHRVLIPGLVLLTVPLMVLLMLGLVLVGAYAVESRAVPESPMWLRSRVSRAFSWSNIKACIYDTGFCRDLEFRTIGLTSYDFSMLKLSPVESGCCKPPDMCGMEYVNATFWLSGKGDGDAKGSYPSLDDCNAWSNKRNQLCYGCRACKKGFLKITEQEWRQVGIFLILMAILFMVTHGSRLVIIMMSERHDLEPSMFPFSFKQF